MKDFRNSFEETYAKIFNVGPNAFSRFMSDSVYSDPIVATAYRMYQEGIKSCERKEYTGTGSDYLDCVLGVGGFEQYGPIEK